MVPVRIANCAMLDLAFFPLVPNLLIIAITPVIAINTAIKLPLAANIVCQETSFKVESAFTNITILKVKITN